MSQKATDAPLPFSKAQRERAGVKDTKMREWYMDCRAFAHDVLRIEGDKWQDLFWCALSGPHMDKELIQEGCMPSKRQLALKACKGPGKTFAEAVGGWWWLLTRWHCNGAAMSITGDNLKDNLWTEFARLQDRAPLLAHFFAHRGERIEAKDYPKDWWLSARSFPQNADKTQQANTLAGLHGRHPLVICDEAGDYPDGVVVAAEAILSSLVDGRPPDGRIIIAGNPTSTEGPLYRVTTKDRPRWWVYEITSDPKDPNRTPRVDPEWAQAQIDLWGVDSDFVKVNILGQFPSQQANKLVGPELALAAAQRKLTDHFKQEALIFGLDVAAYGDCASVLFQRQGQMTWVPKVWRDVNHMVLADQVAVEYETKRPSAVFVDASPVSTGLIDRLRGLGVPVFAIDFGGSALDSRFKDRRSEMYFKMAQWLKQGGCIPDLVQLRTEICAPNYGIASTGKLSKMKLESKEDMKKRGVSSPDMADALALTFAAPVVGRGPQPTGRDALDHLGLSGKNTSIAVDPALYIPHEPTMWSGRMTGGTEASWDPYAED